MMIDSYHQTLLRINQSNAQFASRNAVLTAGLLVLLVECVSKTWFARVPMKPWDPHAQHPVLQLALARDV